MGKLSINVTPEDGSVLANLSEHFKDMSAEMGDEMPEKTDETPEVPEDEETPEEEAAETPEKEAEEEAEGMEK